MEVKGLNITATEKLLALGSALYLLGLEIEGDYEFMSKLYDQGKSLSSPEMIQAAQVHGRHCVKFMKFEDQFLSLQKELEAGSAEQNSCD